MLYIHIPFCKGKCIYCDFYSAGVPLRQPFIKALVNELSLRRNELTECLSSIYIGGGTPSLLTPSEFHELTASVFEILKQQNVRFAADFEFTVEANPEDVNADRIKAWREAGVNRVSLGVQSLDDNELRFLKRRHNAGRALEAIEKIASQFNNFSLDFIYAIPGQTLGSLESSISRALLFNPPHISVYALTYEKGTPLDVQRGRGDFEAASDDLYNVMDEKVAEWLERGGLERYEISNFAKPGFRSRHNSGYWQFRPYLGLGPSASSFDGKDTRRINRFDLKGYINRFSVPSAHSVPFFEEEKLSVSDKMIEFIMVSLRRKEGIELKKFELEFGHPQLKKLLDKSLSFVNSGHLSATPDSLSLTKKGIHISDFIISSLI